MAKSRIDPVKEFASIRDSVTRVIGQGLQSVTGNVFILLDIYETTDAVIIRTSSLDGALPESIEVSMEEDVLTIKGETQEKSDIPEEHYLQRERRFGKFSRSVRIPRAVQAESAQAKLKNGVLTIILPKIEDSRTQVIDVTSTD